MSDILLTPRALTARIFGTPTPQGSKKAFYNSKAKRAVVVDDNSDKLKSWREQVHLGVRHAIETTPVWRELTKDTPIEADLVFLMPRPKSHYRTGKNAHLLRADAPVLHTQTPDGDKLVRSVFDALTTAGAVFDDSQIAKHSYLKRWCPPRVEPGVLIYLSTLASGLEGLGVSYADPDHKQVLVYDADGRQVDWIRANPTLQIESVADGVYEVNTGRHTYTVRTPEGGRVEVIGQ